MLQGSPHTQTVKHCFVNTSTISRLIHPGRTDALLPASPCTAPLCPCGTSTPRQPPLPSCAATYGASYHHHSLCCRTLAACGCCPRLPCGLCPGKHRYGLRNTAGPTPAHWNRREEKHQLASRTQASSSPQRHTTLSTFHFPVRNSQVVGNSQLQRSKKYSIAS